MKKLTKFFIIFVILMVCVFFILSFFIGAGIKAGTEHLGPEIAKVDMSLDSAKVSIISGRGELHGLTVYNPKGFTSKYSFNAENITLDLEPASLISDKIVIEEILIIGPHIVFEQKNGTNNLAQIMENISDFIGDVEKSEETTSGSKKLEIRKFVLEGAKVEVVGDSPLMIELPTITLNDLGTDEDGLSGLEIFSELSQSLLNTIVLEILKNPEYVIQQSGNILNKFKGLFDSDEKEEENIPKD